MRFACSVGAGVFAEAETRIAHLTDVHFGATDPAVVAGISADVRAFAPALVVVSGDLTMGARRTEFRAARDFMDSLGAPFLAVPGNHDITPYRIFERFFLPYERWRDEIAPETEPAWMDARVAVLGLNTARRMGPNLDWSRGRVTGLRLRQLRARLQAVPAERVRIVAAHHPLLPPPGERLKQIAGNAGEALRALAEDGVRLILSGHLHRRYARFYEAGGRRGPLVLQGGSATSVRLRGDPNTYHRVRVNGAGDICITARLWQGTGWTDAPDLVFPGDGAAVGVEVVAGPA